jgi:hypothetical protein
MGSLIQLGPMHVDIPRHIPDNPPKFEHGSSMNRTFAILAFLLTGAAALVAGCTVNPCDDLQTYAVGCQDPDVVELIARVLEAGDKDTCRMYRDAWGYTFFPRCFYMPDAGTTADGSSDGGFDASDAQTPADASAPDTGSADAASGDSGTDSGGMDATPDGGIADSGDLDASAD